MKDFNYHNDASLEIIKRAKELRKTMTRTEKILWKYLKSRRFGNYKFRRQHPIGSYILDFYCHQARLAIEVDGEVHDSPEAQLNDKGRTRDINQLGIQILRFKNQQVDFDLEFVLSEIELHLEGRR